MSVRTVRVGDVLHLDRRPAEIDPSALYKYIGVRSFARGLMKYPPTAGDQLAKMRYFALPANALVVSNIKAWEGAVAVTDGDDDDRVVSNRFLVYVPKSPDVDVRYVWHYFASDGGNKSLSAASPGSADRNRTLGIGAFESLAIPLPGLDEQRRIAAHLDAIGSAADRILAGPSSIVQGVLGGLLYAPTARGDLGTLIEIDDSEIGVDGESTYKRVGVRNHGRGLFEQPPLVGSETSYSKLRVVRSGQVVLSRLKAFEGGVGIADDSHDGAVVSREFHTYNLREPDVDSGYVAALLRMPAIWEQLQEMSTGVGARRERVGADALLRVQVPLPNPETRRAISRQAQRALRAARLFEERSRLAAALLPAARNEEFARLTFE